MEFMQEYATKKFQKEGMSKEDAEKRQRMRIEKNPKKKPEWIWDAICHMKNSNKSFSGTCYKRRKRVLCST